jgi:hypothetical protein
MKINSADSGKRNCSEKKILILMAVIFFFLPSDKGLAETYKYVDENGSLYFVDSVDRIPAQYRKNYQILREINREEKVPKKLTAPVPETSLLGRWEYQGSENGNSYTVIMSLRPKGVFDGNGFKKMGGKTLVWMFKGTWWVKEGDLVLTYTWSSAPEPKRGTTQYDAILEVNDQFLEVKSGRTGESVRYTRK